MRILFLLLSPMLLWSQETPRAPALADFGVRNGASFSPVRQDFGGQLAPGSIFVAQGAWLGPGELVMTAAPYPPALAGAQLEIRSTASGEVFAAPMIHAWEFQLAGIIPAELPVGEAEVTAIYQGRRSEPVAISIAAFAPTLFSLYGAGGGPALAQNWRPDGQTSLNRFTSPARPGQTVILWGTGLNNADGAREVTVRVGDGAGEVELVPFYAGPAPGLPGVDQINVTLPPSGFPLGCLVRLSIVVDNSGFSSTTLATASGDGPCVHRWGLSEQELRTLDEGGRLKVANLMLNDRQFLSGSELSPRSFVAAQVFRSLAAADGLESLSGGGGFSGLFANAPFSCGGGGVISVGSIIGGPVEPLPQPAPGRLPVSFGDAGESLRLRGPDGQAFDVAKIVPTGPFSPEPYYQLEGTLDAGAFTPGDWTLTAPGGSDIGSFEGRVRVPPIPDIAPPDRIRRDADIEVSWDGSNYQPGDKVRVQVGVAVDAEPGTSRVDGTYCIAEATLGGFRIPRQSLERLDTPADGFAEFTVGIESTTEFDSPALSYGRGSFSASRSVRVPFP